MPTISIGEKLITLRAGSGKRQKDVAKAVNITRQALSNYERNKRIPDAAILVRIADYYGVTVDSILR